MRRVLWFLQFLAIICITLPIAVLPLRASLRLGESLGGLLFFLWGSRRRIAIENLRGAAERKALSLDSSPEEVAREHFRNLGRSFVEVIKIYYGLGEGIVRDVEIRGVEHFREALEKGKGVLAISGHCGNWELPALVCAEKISRVNVVARPIDNPYLNRLVERARRKSGNSVIYKKGALKNILSALKRGEVVAILMDQSVVPAEGVAAEFLGKKDYTMKTPAVIAMKTGAAVLPIFISRKGRGHRIEVGELIEVDAGGDDFDAAVYRNTVKFSRKVEEYIGNHPSEWLWIHRRWKRFPSG